MGAPLVGTAPIFALSFFGFDWGKQLVKDISGTGSKDLNALQLAAAGGFSGILTTTIMAPGERIKCILQVRINWPLYIYYCQFGCGISKMVGPKKQAFCPRINILKRNFDTKYFEPLMIFSN